MTSVFVRADPPAPKGIIILKPEPLDSVLGKWLAWILGLIVFLLGLIYFSNYFAKPKLDCNLDRDFSNRYNLADDEDYSILPYKEHVRTAFDNSNERKPYVNTTVADHVPHL